MGEKCSSLCFDGLEKYSVLPEGVNIMHGSDYNSYTSVTYKGMYVSRTIGLWNELSPFKFMQ